MTVVELNGAIAEACPHLFTQDPYSDWYWLQNGAEWKRCVNGSICLDRNALGLAIYDEVCGVEMLETEFLNRLSRIIESNSDDDGGLVVYKRDMVLIVAKVEWLAEAFCQVIDIKQHRKQPD